MISIQISLSIKNTISLNVNFLSFEFCVSFSYWLNFQLAWKHCAVSVHYLSSWPLALGLDVHVTNCIVTWMLSSNKQLRQNWLLFNDSIVFIFLLNLIKNKKKLPLLGVLPYSSLFFRHTTMSYYDKVIYYLLWKNERLASYINDFSQCFTLIISISYESKRSLDHLI